MKTLKEATDYIYNHIKDYDKDDGEILDYDVIYDMLEEELLDIVEWVLTNEDMKIWIESKNDSYLDEVLNERLVDYPALLQEMTNDILNEYVLDE